MMSVFLLLLTSCETLRCVDEVLPDIYFPKFPISASDPNISFSMEKTAVLIYWKDTGKHALIPLEVWEDFVEYVIDVEEARKKYKALQEAYGKETQLSD